ncbi:CAP domain-containing protein [Paraburkholderia metrosideri]|uniref:CAP domain-containing protein n=1 Tax=Paraburkholderia metrosideri TaxID=580937 RepID=A0ABW9E806_9BURK
MNKAAKTAASAISSIALAVALAACGGGGSSSNPTGQTSSTGQTGSTASTPQPIALLAATGSSVGSPTLTGDVIADSFAYANNKRAQLGLSPLKQIAQVSTAAQNHAIYMYDANAVGHYETAGQPGYTGVAPPDRIAAAGYATNSVGEIAAGIGGTFTSSTEAVDGLFDAPFHRAIFIFDTTGVGFGQGPSNTDSTKYSTLVGDFVDYVQQTPDNKLVAYPYDGQTNVRPSWIANESPNPMANYPTYINQTVGYPVTLSASDNGAFSNINFIITDPSGNAVTCAETDNTNNSEATRLALCVPFKPLANNATYKVTVTGSLTNTSIPTAQAFSVSWSFTTGVAAAVQARQLPAASGAPIRPVFN